jgi:maltose alpha-D-glucosyltransferase/alpha-amylase
MERDRRRVELMNALLLSMPGTPVLYYGDEIGMGDNIYLGDRDGVRTPMQWSPDRNGGFSRADPARLILPPIMDPLYGYEAVNVEAQSADAHSLLNWTRRMLALRGQHVAFGRGTQRFLTPGNRKILAYLRDYEGDTILCVFNLSRLPQAVELDLSEFEGRVPIELTGMSPFPPIGQLTYLLTLPPYGFFWFQLVAETDGPVWRKDPPEQLPDFSTMVMRRDLLEVVDEPRLADALSRDVLPSYLAKRRWFSSKGETLHGARIVSAVPMGFPHNILLGELEAELEGHTETYMLPLAVAWDDTNPHALAQQLALARIRQGRRVGFLTDGFAMESFARGVLKGLVERTQISGRSGTLEFIGTDRLDGIDIADDLPIHWLSAEQSNSSLIVGNLAMVKLIRHIFPGIHPEAEMTRYLTSVGYENTAPLLGEVVRTAPDGTRSTLIIIQGAIRNQGDAWNWMLDTLRRTIDDTLVSGDGAADPGHELFNPLMDFISNVGTRLGELHVALARPTEDEAFSPVNADEGDVEALRRQVVGQIGDGLDILDAARREVDPALTGDIDSLIAQRETILASIGSLAERVAGTHMIRNHGDFHLGQILVAEADAYIIDFEGEPARTLEERRAKTNPLRDVAGLLRSLSYLAATAELDHEASSDVDIDKRNAQIRAFTKRAEDAFLSHYFAVTETSVSLGLDPQNRTAILDLFLLEKAAYEIAYEARNRPKWLPIPLAGFSAIVRRLSESEA